MLSTTGRTQEMLSKDVTERNKVRVLLLFKAKRAPTIVPKAPTRQPEVFKITSANIDVKPLVYWGPFLRPSVTDGIMAS